MNYSFMFEGKKIELPQYTISIGEILEQTDNIKFGDTSFAEKIRALYKNCEDIIGEKVTEIIGDVETCDPNRVVLLQQGIVDTYNKPVDDAQLKAMKEKMESLDAEKMVELAKIVDENK